MKHDSDVNDNFRGNTGVVQSRCVVRTAGNVSLDVPLFAGLFLGCSLGGHDRKEGQMIQLMFLFAAFGRLKVESDNWG